jgi:hypothetical protein
MVAQRKHDRADFKARVALEALVGPKRKLGLETVYSQPRVPHSLGGYPVRFYTLFQNSELFGL